jgi:WD40 repeat protein
VGSVAYSQDGRRIVSGSADGTVRVWDAETGSAIGDPLVGHIDNVGSVAINSERHLIASGSSDGTIRIWPATASPEDLCAKLTANMSEKHWDEWVSPDIDYIKTCPDLPIAAD